ncbi:MAG: hypothetical protein RBT55_02150 [Rhodocyclaceae bacterium]|jgi:hypothetical protein|nr:hypothetical protein [Rhodocyclaceae bacterium]
MKSDLSSMPGTPAVILPGHTPKPSRSSLPVFAAHRLALYVLAAACLLDLWMP